MWVLSGLVQAADAQGSGQESGGAALAVALWVLGVTLVIIDMIVRGRK